MLVCMEKKKRKTSLPRKTASASVENRIKPDRRERLVSVSSSGLLDCLIKSSMNRPSCCLTDDAAAMRNMFNRSLKSESELWTPHFIWNIPDFHTADGFTVTPQLFSLAELFCIPCMRLKNVSISIWGQKSWTLMMMVQMKTGPERWLWSETRKIT